MRAAVAGSGALQANGGNVVGVTSADQVVVRDVLLAQGGHVGQLGKPSGGTMNRHNILLSFLSSMGRGQVFPKLEDTNRKVFNRLIPNDFLQKYLSRLHLPKTLYSQCAILLLHNSIADCVDVVKG